MLNVADVNAKSPPKDFGVYSASKAALLSLNHSMACEWAPKVRVNAISPGPILWPENAGELSDDVKRQVLESTCLQRLGGEESIARAALYLLDATFVTGHNLHVDGGKSLNKNAQP